MTMLVWLNFVRWEAAFGPPIALSRFARKDLPLLVAASAKTLCELAFLACTPLSSSAVASQCDLSTLV